MREPYPDDDGTLLRECKGCAGEYAIRTDDALKSVGLVGEGCPWATVQQMADDLGLAETDARAFAASHGTFQRADRLTAAADLLSSGSNP